MNAFGCIMVKGELLFCYKYSKLFTYFRRWNGIGDLLALQARNFICTVLHYILQQELSEDNKACLMVP